MRVYDKGQNQKVQQEVAHIDDNRRRPDGEQITFALQNSLKLAFGGERLKFYLLYIITVLFGGIGLHKFIGKSFGSGFIRIILLAAGLGLWYTKMEGFAGTLVYYGAYVILGIWALLLIVDLLFITADETKEAFNEAFTYNSGIILFALAVLFYQWLYLNYTELPLLGNLVAEIDALLKTILPQG
jgi:hypothetical protein